MKHTARELIKFKKLQRRLGLSKAREVIGLLESMWHLTQRECPRGDIGRLDDESIAIELEWDGEPSHLISAMVETGWLDECAEHRLVVHDWAEHAPRFVHGIAARKGGILVATKATAHIAADPDYSEALQSSTIVPDETLASEPLACAGTTKPNLTKPNLNKKQAFDEFAKSKLLDNPRFQAVWDSWGRHLLESGKPLTMTASAAQLIEIERTGWPVEDCIAAVHFTIRAGARNLILNGDHKRPARDPPAVASSSGGKRKAPTFEEVRYGRT